MPNVYQSRDSLQFSQSDSRIGGVNLSRLDRFYVDDAWLPRGGTINIMSDITFFRSCARYIGVVWAN